MWLPVRTKKEKLRAPQKTHSTQRDHPSPTSPRLNGLKRPIPSTQAPHEVAFLRLTCSKVHFNLIFLETQHLYGEPQDTLRGSTPKAHTADAQEAS